MTQRPKPAALVIDTIGDQMQRVVGIRSIGPPFHRRPGPRGDVPQCAGEAKLILLGQILTTDKHVGIVTPCPADFRDDIRIELLSEIYTADRHADGRRQRCKLKIWDILAAGGQKTAPLLAYPTIPAGSKLCGKRCTASPVVGAILRWFLWASDLKSTSRMVR